MADAGARRHHPEVVEGALPPLQELVALDVALVLAVDVELEGARGAELVDHHRVVDDEVDRVQRVDLLRVAAERLDPVAHGGEVDDRRHAGEVLHQHPRRPVGDLARVPAALGRPFGEGADVVDGDGLAVLEAQHVLQNDLKRCRQATEIAETCRLGRSDRVEGVVLARDRETAARPGAVGSNENGHRGLRASWLGQELAWYDASAPTPQVPAGAKCMPSYTMTVAARRAGRRSKGRPAALTRGHRRRFPVGFL